VASARTGSRSVGAAPRLGGAVITATAGLIVSALGVRLRRAGACNVAIVDAAHRDYIAALAARGPRARAAHTGA